MDIMGAYSFFLLINWGLCPKFHAPSKEPLSLTHHNLFLTLLVPQNKSKWTSSPFASPLLFYIQESSTLVKAHGIKVWCYWEHIENLMGTKKKIPPLPPPPTLKTQKESLSACWTFSSNYVLKPFITIFFIKVKGRKGVHGCKFIYNIELNPNTLKTCNIVFQGVHCEVYSWIIVNSNACLLKRHIKLFNLIWLLYISWLWSQIHT
jgi:hypothetical protein